MALASPRSVASSQTSFHTALESEASESTSASSPAQRRPCPYRKAKPLPRELKEHTQIFLEEQLYVQASQLLSSILTAGNSRSSRPTKPVAVPPPSHIALLTTLLVHPSQTTRPSKPEQVDVVAFARSYLHNLLHTVGPVEADFRSAFQFQSVPRSGRRAAGAFSGHSSDVDSPLRDGEDDGNNGYTMRGHMANEGSVWRRGQDFWSTAGWAFNCSTLYPQRWRFWKSWLEFMVDVLEADWRERERMDLEKHDGEGPCPTAERNESIIVMYIDQQKATQGGFKKVIKALLADGGSLSTAAFREVFDREPRGPKRDSNKRKREDVTLDIENGNFADYFDDDAFSSGASQPPTPEKTRDMRGSTFGTLWPGLVESIDLRLRLFALVSNATLATGKKGDLGRLYELFAGSAKVVPLEFFALLVGHRVDDPPVHVTMVKELLHMLLPASYKDPAKVDAAAEAEGSLTSEMLRQCYVLHPANTVGIEDNAKLSLVIEKAILLLWACDDLQWTDDLAEAVEKGISARDAKVQKKRTGKAKLDPDDTLAQTVLKGSGERLRALIESLDDES